MVGFRDKIIYSLLIAYGKTFIEKPSQLRGPGIHRVD